MISRTRLVVRIAGALTRIPNQTQAILPMLNAQMLAGKVFIEVSIAPIMTNTVPVHCRTLSKRVGLLMGRNQLLWFSPPLLWFLACRNFSVSHWYRGPCSGVSDHHPTSMVWCHRIDNDTADHQQ